MTPVTHIVSGLALVTVLNKIGIVSVDIMPLWQSLIWVALISGISLMPDVNMLWSHIKHHHDDFTHYPFFWLFISFCLGIVEYTRTSQIELTIIFLSLIFLHMLLDTVGFSLGIKWFAPFSKKEISFTRLNKDVLEFSLKEKGKLYFKYTALKVEVIVLFVSGAVLVLLR